ncbi:MAG: FAD-dependent oxidoreductase [Woeseiaceae bacterium]|nr:FAD-dependent oxidoreductase [Woeseiaceae bacterium]
MLNRRLFLAGTAGAIISGCSAGPGLRHAGFAHPVPLAPLKFSADRLMRITVCSRPFRPAGPRLEAEAFDGKLVVHNYGQGGSGWSLSWGCAEEATALALTDGPREVAVIGAGVMGLTTALRLVETGVRVTIYAKEFPMETRSSRATGVWSPSSRIGLADAVDRSFPDRWERWARFSLEAHQRYLGAIGDPVEFVPAYNLFDESDRPHASGKHDFLKLDSRIDDAVPGFSAVPPDTVPFPVARAESGLYMTFNVASYAQRLTQDFLAHGGRMLRRELPDRAAALALPEPVIVNCAGYGAKSLWQDDDLVPVRGQINWLAPQPEARYSVFYNNVVGLSRRDGVIVQYVGPDDDWGYGDDSEIADRQEMLDALATLRPLFS